MSWLYQALLIVIGGALGVLLSPTEDTWKSWVLSQGGELTGRWREELSPAYHKPFIRIDELRVRHRKYSGRVSVQVTRIEPAGESGRKWRMSGHLRGDELCLVFWPVGKEYDGSSYGVMVLHRDTASVGKRWKGVYIRPGTDLGRYPGTSNLERIEAIWTKL
jgi:hypothetical protein